MDDRVRHEIVALQQCLEGNVLVLHGVMGEEETGELLVSSEAIHLPSHLAADTLAQAGVFGEDAEDLGGGEQQEGAGTGADKAEGRFLLDDDRVKGENAAGFHLTDSTVLAVDDIDDAGEDDADVGDFDTIFEDDLTRDEVATQSEVNKVLELRRREKVEVGNCSEELCEVRGALFVC